MTNTKLFNRLFRLSFLLCFVLLCACTEDKNVSAPIELLCESQENPIGIDCEKPQFSWKLNTSNRGARQSAYRIVVGKSENEITKGNAKVWDSGKILSEESVYVPFEGGKLESNTTYYWAVEVWDEDGKKSHVSETATFETAFLHESDWKAQWIAKNDKEDLLQSIYLRKTFTTSGKPVRARLLVTGLGAYQAFINGERAGLDILSPGWTHYPKRVQYQVYDVTELLKEGNNAIASVLGNSWWSSGLGWKGAERYSEGPLRFLAQLEVEYEDGSRQTILSDESWKWQPSAILETTLYHGETFDARLEQQNWNDVDFDDTTWKEVLSLGNDYMQLVAMQEPPIRITETKEATSITEVKPGVWVFDLGQNIVGWAEINVNGAAGDSVTMRFAELLHEDGTVAQENLRSAKATDYYILKGEETESWEPQFTYHGFRYVQVEGLKNKPSKETLVAKVFHTDAHRHGSFKSSNDLINRIHSNITWGQRGNFMSVPTDCPQRDERLGWMGDAQIFAPTSMYNMDLGRFYEKWMHDITDCQDESGYVYDVNPAIVVGGPSKPGWGDAVVVVPYQVYKFTGNKRILEENYEAMKAWVEFMHKESADYLYIWNFDKNNWYGYGDWIAPVKTPSKPIGTAYFFYSSKLLSEIAAILGNNTDQQKYAEMAKSIAEAYQQTWYLPDSLNYHGQTQTANLLPLAFGITPAELSKQIAKNVADDVIVRDVHPSTGFLGTGYILPMLSEHGYHDLAYQLITQTSYPSWGYMVENGATSIWELWNSDKERPEGMNSRNHFALGCIGEWYYGYLAGLQPDINKPGYKNAIIRPMPVGDLTHVDASIETPYGKLASSWKKDADVFSLDLTIPANSSASLSLPDLGYKNPIIKEGNTTIFEDGKALTMAEGIKYDNNEAGKLNFTLGSGKYTFTISDK